VQAAPPAPQLLGLAAMQTLLAQQPAHVPSHAHCWFVQLSPKSLQFWHAPPACPQREGAVPA
jgi:hypothetical protein